MRIRSALISVYHKAGLEKVLQLLKSQEVTIYSTGGTYDYLLEQGLQAIQIEDVTSYPSILGGRVKTLHPKVFGGILGRRSLDTDVAEMEIYEIPALDLVIVDLYPFEETLKSGANHASIIEKIDIGGISLIRAAAKNYEHVVVVPSQKQYSTLEKILEEEGGKVSYGQRKQLAAEAFRISSNYDNLIAEYMGAAAQNFGEIPISSQNKRSLRYGENPHQQAAFIGNLEKVFNQLHGKELSYNNLVDIDAALGLISEFDETAFIIIKHTNPCGCAIGKTPKLAWELALAADPVSAFGGILACNKQIDTETAAAMDEIFFEVCIAPSYSEEALNILKKKKNRIILELKNFKPSPMQYRSVLNGVLEQEYDTKKEIETDLKVVTDKAPTASEVEDLLFANRLVKHAKSNAIILAKNQQLIGIGVGQTSRVDALQQAIEKAKKFNFSLGSAVMASDAFFPFPDCVTIAQAAGVTAIIQPGGSIKDQDSIDACNNFSISMVTTGYRHFKH